MIFLQVNSIEIPGNSSENVGKWIDIHQSATTMKLTGKIIFLPVFYWENLMQCACGTDISEIQG